MNTCELGSLLTGTDCTQMNPKLREMECHETNHNHNQRAGQLQLVLVQQNHRCICSDRSTRSQILDDAAEQEHGTDCNDEGLDLPVDIEESVDCSDAGSCRDSGQDSDRYRRYLGNHADDDRSHTQNRTLREIKAAHCHDKEDACRRNHGDIDLCHNHGKVLQHPALCQDIKDNKDNYQSDDRKKRADQRDVRLSLKCFIL